MRRRLPISFLVLLFAVTVSNKAASQAGPDASDTPDSAATTIQDDANPTRAVRFSLRPELYVPNSDVTQAALIFRYDQAMLRKRRWLPGERGVVLRFEAPLSVTRVNGAAGQVGVGDVYAQLLLVPYFTRTFAFVAGTGVVLPTATGSLLGTGKVILAPAVGPAWFMGRRGMVFVKFQNLTSVAGKSNRSDMNLLLITPTVVHTVGKRWWVLADSESKTDWRRDHRTGVKSGLQIGWTAKPTLGVWIKPEVWWGPNQDGGWNLKGGFVWFR